MSDAYKQAKPGRLVFKGGEAATLDKHKKKKHKKKRPTTTSADEAAAPDDAAAVEGGGAAGDGGGGEVYTIDAAKRMKYEELFPVEARKFGYDPANAASGGGAGGGGVSSRSVEEALDDRVRKKADRYCK